MAYNALGPCVTCENYECASRAWIPLYSSICSEIFFSFSCNSVISRNKRMNRIGMHQTCEL